MRIYRLDKPHPVLIDDAKLDIAPIKNHANEPVSGYALVTTRHFIELSFDEVKALAALPHEAKGLLA